MKGGGSQAGLTKERNCVVCGVMSTVSMYVSDNNAKCEGCKKKKGKSPSALSKAQGEAKSIQQVQVGVVGNAGVGKGELLKVIPANSIVCTNCFNPDNVLVEIFRNRSIMEARILKKDTGELIDRLPVSWKARENKLDYLSVSKIQAYEGCPSSFYRQYMSEDGVEEDNGNFFTKFGTILHHTVERASQIFSETGIVVNGTSLYDEAWKELDLTGFEAYTEGKDLIKDYFARNPINQQRHKPLIFPDGKIGVEYEWRGELGGTTFGMQMDYIGQFISDPTTGILADYKSNRMPFTPGDLESSFQLRVYMLVCQRHLFPDIKKWVAGYEMFRFGWQQCPQWTQDDLLDAEQYIANTWHQISNDNTWEEKLNNYCGYRKCRLTCKTYADYVNNPKRYIDLIKTDLSDLSKIEADRELISACEKIVKTRKDDLAAIMKTEVEKMMVQGKKLIIDGKELQLYSNPTQSYRYHDTRNVLIANGAVGMLDDCISIGKTKFDKKLAEQPHLLLAVSGCKDTNYASAYITKKKAIVEKSK